MGKGARNRGSRTSDLAVSDVKRNAGKKDNTGKMVGIICAILAVLVAAILCTNAFIGSGVLVRGVVSITTDNYEINNGMLSYYFNSIYQNYLSTYSGYISYLGLDTTKPLKSQNAYDGSTWFDYFMTSTRSQLKELVVMAEAAKEAGLTLDSEDNETISNVLAALKAQAKSGGMDYSGFLTAYYGKGVNDDVIKSCLEIEILANKYLEKFRDSLAYTEADYEEYASGNDEDIIKADYRIYRIEAEVYEDMSSEQRAEIMDKAKADAEKIASATTEEEYDALLREYLAVIYPADDDEKAEEEGRSTSAEKIEAAIENSHIEGASYNLNTEIGQWVFADDRKAGDTTVIQSAEDFSACFMINPAHRDETLARNIRRILFYNGDYENDEAAKAKADEVLAEFLAGDKSVESFTELAKRHSYDTGSAENGGLYENYTAGSGNGTSFDGWAFAEERKIGDAEVVVNENYGYDILFYDSDGMPVWQKTARDALMQEDYEAEIERLAEKYSYTEDESKINQIDA